MLKETIAAIVIAAASISAKAETDDIRVTFTDHADKVSSKHVGDCHAPCSLIYRNVDLSQDVLIDDALTYTWASGVTSTERFVVRKSDFEKLGVAYGDITYTLHPSKNHNTAEQNAAARKADEQRASNQRINEQRTAKQVAPNYNPNPFVTWFGLLGGLVRAIAPVAVTVGAAYVDAKNESATQYHLPHTTSPLLQSPASASASASAPVAQPAKILTNCTVRQAYEGANVNVNCY